MCPCFCLAFVSNHKRLTRYKRAPTPNQTRNHQREKKRQNNRHSIIPDTVSLSLSLCESNTHTHRQQAHYHNNRLCPHVKYVWAHTCSLELKTAGRREEMILTLKMAVIKTVREMELQFSPCQNAAKSGKREIIINTFNDSQRLRQKLKKCKMRSVSVS